MTFSLLDLLLCTCCQVMRCEAARLFTAQGCRRRGKENQRRSSSSRDKGIGNLVPAQQRRTEAQRVDHFAWAPIACFHALVTAPQFHSAKPILLFISLITYTTLKFISFCRTSFLTGEKAAGAENDGWEIREERCSSRPKSWFE